jgi:hypothetical protein
MSSNESNAMLSLLKELSVYRTLDEEYVAGDKGGAQATAFEERERRRLEIKLEMHALVAESKSNGD